MATGRQTRSWEPRMLFVQPAKQMGPPHLNTGASSRRSACNNNNNNKMQLQYSTSKYTKYYLLNLLYAYVFNC